MTQIRPYEEEALRKSEITFLNSLQINCVSFSTWKKLNSTAGFFIANGPNDEIVVSCRITRRRREIDEFVQTLNVAASCSILRVARISDSIGRLRLRIGDEQYRNARELKPKDGLQVTCDRITLSDYIYDFECRPEIVTCSFTRNLPFTTMPVPAPTNETKQEPIVEAGGLDFWVYIIIVCVTVGLIVLVGFSRNIIKAVSLFYFIIIFSKGRNWKGVLKPLERIYGGLVAVRKRRPQKIAKN